MDDKRAEKRREVAAAVALIRRRKEDEQQHRRLGVDASASQGHDLLRGGDAGWRALFFFSFFFPARHVCRWERLQFAAQ